MVATGLVFLAMFYITGLLVKKYLLKEGMADVKSEESGTSTMKTSSVGGIYSLLYKNQDLVVGLNEDKINIKYDAGKQKACVLQNGKLRGCLKFDIFAKTVCILDDQEKQRDCLQFNEKENQLCIVREDGTKGACLKYIPGKMPAFAEMLPNANANATASGTASGTTFEIGSALPAITQSASALVSQSASQSASASASQSASASASQSASVSQSNPNALEINEYPLKYSNDNGLTGFFTLKSVTTGVVVYIKISGSQIIVGSEDSSEKPLANIIDKSIINDYKNTVKIVLQNDGFEIEINKTKSIFYENKWGLDMKNIKMYPKNNTS